MFRGTPCSSIFEVLLCHINNFSSFTLINVWWREFDFSGYLLKFLSVRPQYIGSTMTMRLCIFRKIFVFYRIISQNFRFLFSRNFCFIYFEMFSHNFSHFLRNRLKRNFAKIFAFFASERNAKTRRNGREKKVKFSRNDLLETIDKTLFYIYIFKLYSRQKTKFELQFVFFLYFQIVIEASSFVDISVLNINRNSSFFPFLDN